MSPDLILILAVVIGIPIAIAILFETLWRVPKADEAPIITGFGVKGAPARRAEIELGPTASRRRSRRRPARRSGSSRAAAPS